MISIKTMMTRRYPNAVYSLITLWAAFSFPLLKAAQLEPYGLQTVASSELEVPHLRSIPSADSNTITLKRLGVYKLLLKDGTNAMVPSDAIRIPVRLEGGNADIPLGAAKALKFQFNEKNASLQNIIIRFISGHVYQLPWTGRSDMLDVKDIYGDRLRTPYANILGILPLTDDAPLPASTSYDLFSFKLKDASELTAHMPLQIWKLSTSFGSISFPSPLVQSCTLSASWRGTTTIKTLYGETFKGRSDFRHISMQQQHEETVERIRTSKLLSIRNLRATVLDIPRNAFVITLRDGSQIAAMPTEQPVVFATPNGDQIHLDLLTTLSSDMNGGFMINREEEEPVACKPAYDSLEVVLAINGQRIRIAWREIQRIEMMQRIIGTSVPDLSKSSDSVESLSLFGSGTETKPTSLTIPLSWGTIELDSDAIAGLALNKKPRLAYLTTTSGDLLRIKKNTRRRRRTVQSIIDNAAPPLLDFKTLRLPDFHVKAHGTAILRLIQGDILLGTLSENDFPFQSLDSSDRRSSLLTETVKTLMRTGEGKFAYVTDQGMLFGHPSREKIKFILRSTNQKITIPLNLIEFLTTQSGPLPPFSWFIAGYPPGLTGEIKMQAGSFYQGSEDSRISDESPRIEVTLGSFYMDATQVTRAQFARFINTTGYVTTAERSGASQTWRNPGFIQMPDDPVVCVSWYDAVEFCNWRSRQSHLEPVYSFRRNGIVVTDRNADGYRLPTESEWEYAAGGIRGVIFPWGNSKPDPNTSAAKANYRQRDGEVDDGWRWTNPVNAFPPTPEGLYGMAGNVWEWCEDWYFDMAYDLLQNRSPYNPSITKTEAPGRTHRVMRGGSYQNRIDLLRVSSRGNGVPGAYAPHVGFRCVRNAIPPENP